MIWQYAVTESNQAIRHPSYPFAIPLCNAIPAYQIETYPEYLRNNSFLLEPSQASVNWIEWIGQAARNDPLQLTIANLEDVPEDVQEWLFVYLSLCKKLDLTILSGFCALEDAWDNANLNPMHSFARVIGPHSSNMLRNYTLCESHTHRIRLGLVRRAAYVAHLQRQAEWEARWHWSRVWRKVKENFVAGCAHECRHPAYWGASKTQSIIRLASAGFVYDGDVCYGCVREELRSVRKGQQVAKDARETDLARQVREVEVTWQMLG